MNYNEIKNFIQTNVQYKDWEFHVKNKGVAIFLQIQFMEKCAVSGKIERQYCRKWLLSENMTDTELVRTCWKAVQAAVEHEAAENFKFKDQPIYSPHHNVYRIAGDMEYNGDSHEETFDVRKEPAQSTATSPEVDRDIQDEINEFNYKVKVDGDLDDN